MKYRNCWLSCGLLLFLAMLVPYAAYASCSLTEATMVMPRNGTRVVIGPNTDSMPMAFVVQPDCVSGTSYADFTLDGATLGGTVNGYPFGVIYSTLGSLALGTHTAGATCYSLSDETPATFTLVAADASVDSDGNGIPDNPFTTLAGDGYLWLGRGISVATSMDRSVAVMRWTGSGETEEDYAPVTVALADPENPTHKVTVSMPQELLESGEPAMLIVALANSPEKLVGSTEAAEITEVPLGHESGSLYLAFDIIISMDGGLTFRTMSASRIADIPIHVAFEGLTVASGDTIGIYRYSAGIDGDLKSPLEFAVDGTTWSSARVTNKVYRAATTSVTCLVEADVKAQGIYSPFLASSVDDGDDSDDDGDGTVDSGDIPGIMAAFLAVLLGLLGMQIQDFENAGGSPCFIATAAFGTPMAHSIDALRMFRDVFLLDNTFGAAFVDMYYRISPSIADVIAQYPALAMVVRMVLWPIIWLVRIIMAVPALAWICSATLIGFSLLKRHKRPKTEPEK